VSVTHDLDSKSRTRRASHSHSYVAAHDVPTLKLYCSSSGLWSLVSGAREAFECVAITSSTRHAHAGPQAGTFVNPPEVFAQTLGRVVPLRARGRRGRSMGFWPSSDPHLPAALRSGSRRVWWTERIHARLIAGLLQIELIPTNMLRGPPYVTLVEGRVFAPAPGRPSRTAPRYGVAAPATPPAGPGAGADRPGPGPSRGGAGCELGAATGHRLALGSCILDLDLHGAVLLVTGLEELVPFLQDDTMGPQQERKSRAATPTRPAAADDPRPP